YLCTERKSQSNNSASEAVVRRLLINSTISRKTLSNRISSIADFLIRTIGSAMPKYSKSEN
ncbi:MAG TPA: hypothetical protein VLH37_03885, partial [Bacteroidales bacterium]|nr:hypothetical protein [Bacteroidales bacterium]